MVENKCRVPFINNGVLSFVSLPVEDYNNCPRFNQMATHSVSFIIMVYLQTINRSKYIHGNRSPVFNIMAITIVCLKCKNIPITALKYFPILNLARSKGAVS